MVRLGLDEGFLAGWIRELWRSPGAGAGMAGLGQAGVEGAFWRGGEEDLGLGFGFRRRSLSVRYGEGSGGN